MSQEALDQILLDRDYSISQIMEIRGKMGNRNYWMKGSLEAKAGVEALLGTLALSNPDPEVRKLAMGTALDYSHRKVYIETHPLPKEWQQLASKERGAI